MNRILSEIFIKDFVNYLEKQFPIYGSMNKKRFGTYIEALGDNVCAQSILVAIPIVKENTIIITRASDATHKMVLKIDDGFDKREKGIYVYHMLNNGELFTPDSKSDKAATNPIRYPYSTNAIEVAKIAQRTMTGDPALKFAEYLLNPVLSVIEKTILFFSDTESFKNMEKTNKRKYLHVCRQLEKISQWLDYWNKADAISYVLQNYYAKQATKSIMQKIPPKFSNKSEELDYSAARLGDVIKKMA